MTFRYYGARWARVTDTQVTTAEFTLVRDGCRGRELLANQTCELGVRFRPSSPGLKAAQLTIMTTGAPCEGGVAAIVLNGEGH